MDTESVLCHCFIFSLSHCSVLVLRNGEMLSLTACSGKSLSLSVWSLTASNEDDNYDESDIEPVVKQVRWMSPQSASANTAIGCCLLLLNDNRLICLSPSGAQGEWLLRKIDAPLCGVHSF